MSTHAIKPQAEFIPHYADEDARPRAATMPRATLDHLPFGTRARVVAIDGRHPAARRLIEMGVIPGTEVTVLRAAPFGDPLQVDVRGCRLALRRTEAAAISIETRAL